MHLPSTVILVEPHAPDALDLTISQRPPLGEARRRHACGWLVDRATAATCSAPVTPLGAGHHFLATHAPAFLPRSWAWPG